MGKRDVRRVAVGDDRMASMLRWYALHHGDEVAVSCEGVALTWDDLDRRSNRLANALADGGIGTGDRVAALLENGLPFVELYFAVAKLGAVATPINFQLTAGEVAYILRDSGARALIYDESKRSLVEGVRGSEDLPLLDAAVVAVGPDGGEYVGFRDRGGDQPPAVELRGDEHFFQGYTSGTTGFPKGCLQRQDAFVAHYLRGHRVYGYGAGEVMLIPGPLFHEAPTLFTLGHLFLGGRVVILPRFDPDEALATIERERCTILGFAVPTMLDRINALEHDRDVSCVRSVITAGAPLRQDTMEAALDTFAQAELHEFYGATEVGLVTDVGHRAELHRGRTAGRVIPGISVAILDDDGEMLPAGDVGQIFISPLMMDGYYQREDAMREATREFDGVRWFTLGDLGYLDEEEYLYLVDRKSHMIISGGENVYPADVENVLGQHPAIAEVAVIGLPDERWGEVVTAVIVPVDQMPTLEDVRAFCADRLAPYKTPKRVIPSETLPRTASGKLQVHVLKEQLEG